MLPLWLCATTPTATISEAYDYEIVKLSDEIEEKEKKIKNLKRELEEEEEAAIANKKNEKN